jgi:hypothetical protein
MSERGDLVTAACWVAFWAKRDRPEGGSRGFMSSHNNIAEPKI